MAKLDPQQETGATTAQAEPARRPYEPPTLIKRGSLSALVAQTITPPPNQAVILL
jgi:hypothetical protein